MAYVLFTIVVFVGVLIWLGRMFYQVAAFPNKKTEEFIYNSNLEEGQFDAQYIESLEKEYFYIDTDNGYQLHCMYIANKESKKTIILSHGITVSMTELYRYIQLYYERGFNVFMLDHRYHGKSGGENSSFGYHEKYDMKKCVDWVLNKVGQDSVVGTHGESMGAAIVLQHASIDDRIKFAIADCPYDEVGNQLAYRLKVEYNLPKFPAVHMASIMNKIMGNGLYSEISPLKAVKNVETPILFIHGKDDEYIPVEHTKHIYDNKNKGIKKLYIVDGADHVQSYIKDKEGYNQAIGEFLEEIGIV